MNECKHSMEWNLLFECTILDAYIYEQLLNVQEIYYCQVFTIFSGRTTKRERERVRERRESARERARESERERERER